MKKPMSVVELIQRKNKIIFDDLGVVLVPEDQIQECPKHKLSLETSTSACPYCHVYNVGMGDCEGCPMAEAGNYCEAAEGSTWEAFTEAITLCNVVEYYASNKKLVKLYKKYNKQFQKDN